MHDNNDNMHNDNNMHDIVIICMIINNMHNNNTDNTHDNENMHNNKYAY